MSNTVWLAIIGGGLSVFWVILAFLIRSWTNEAKTAIKDLKETIKLLFQKLDKVNEREAECRADLPGKYATKIDLEKVEEKTSLNTQAIAVIQTKLTERQNA